MAITRFASCPSPPTDLSLKKKKNQINLIRLSSPKSKSGLTSSLSAASLGPDERTMFIFGTGFVGRYVAQNLIRDGWQVHGTCTSDLKKKELEEMGMKAFIFDANNSDLEGLNTLQNASHMLVSIPPITGLGDPLLNLYENLHGLLDHGNLQWMCYLSSTGVYGDCKGAWVDEDYPVNPIKESAKLRYEAEKKWMEFGSKINLSTFILRLGGIYGPGRSALETVLKGKSLSEGQNRRNSRDYYFTARIHVEDIYQAILASISNPSIGKIYNVVDDDPAPRAEVFEFACDLIKRKYPEIIFNDLNDINLESMQLLKGNMIGEKRVCNLRMKEELGVKLIFPSYKSGLESILHSWPDTLNI
ncbi:hypothetical protein LUZ60_009782 [Juncus effusus]|nr:hypothetical protein LUZ60_009782 [Juncus effusus]